MNESSRLSRRTENADSIKTTSWQFPCLRIEQGEGRFVYCFPIDGKLITEFASVSRIARDKSGDLIGYQRPEVAKHIQSIKSYIDAPGSFIPNAVVLSFVNGISFKQSENQAPGVGSLVISLGKNMEKPGFIVDGQQRLAAIRASTRGEYSIFATAFIAGGEDEQRSQFILVNNTKPLPKGLIHELLPEIHQKLPKSLSDKQIPAAITSDLNLYKKSPFYGLIKMPTNPNGIIASASIQNMVFSSIQNGLLRQSLSQQEFDFEKAVELLVKFWGTVRDVFDTAWGQKPTESRLMHGAGIYSMGALMDYLSIKAPKKNIEPILEAIKPACAWTKGNWKMQSGQVPWDAIENVPQQKANLSKHLIRLTERHL